MQLRIKLHNRPIQLHNTQSIWEHLYECHKCKCFSNYSLCYFGSSYTQIWTEEVNHELLCSSFPHIHHLHFNSLSDESDTFFNDLFIDPRPNHVRPVSQLFFNPLRSLFLVTSLSRPNFPGSSESFQNLFPLIHPFHRRFLPARCLLLTISTHVLHGRISGMLGSQLALYRDQRQKTEEEDS